MPEKKPKTIKLRRLAVTNFKALDELIIQFPPPRMNDDPDIFVMGSKNGLGKTSVLESCALLFLAATVGEEPFDIGRSPDMPINLPELLIRAGTKEANIEGTFAINDKEFKVGLELMMNGKVKIKGNTEPFTELRKRVRMPSMELVQRFLFSLVGLNSEPMINPPFLYFHSYRKVQEGNPELGMMVEGERMILRRPRYRSGYEFPISAFKLQILRSMMGHAKLFEAVEDEHAGEVLTKLNQLVKRFAGGTIEKLRPSQDNTVDFRIYPTETEKKGISFTFDGLSSGQKEIISTLFLIWYHSLSMPAIILIDEPELHLNVEWHRDFVKQVFDLAPQNQYIIATHSEDIFSSVSEDRRVLLVASKEVAK
jgi:predicted ATPase